MLFQRDQQVQRPSVGAVSRVLGKVRMPAAGSGPSKCRSGGKHGNHVLRSLVGLSLDFTLSKMGNNGKF